MSEAWSQWQGQVIDGKFHLKQYLGGSGESAVFLAHLHSGDARVRCEDSESVAIRLMADSANPELQLSRWRMAEDISHPHLLRILDTGRCRLGVIDLIYAVMEYAEENLGQIVPQRPLTVAEACEMLGPALEALSYLHGRGLVHGHIKPAAIMAMNNELKIAVDGIRPAEQPLSLTEPSTPCSSSASPASVSGIYDAPETASGVWLPAADVWSLGVTLAEALTQQLPSTNGLNDSEADPLLPGNLPFELVEIVRGCVRRDLQLRWSVPAIRQRLETRATDQAAAAASVRQPAGASVAPMGPRAPEFESSQPGLPAQQTNETPVAAAALAHAAAASAAAAGPTFSQALRAKPVVSERPAIAQQELARAASASVQGATVIVPSEPQPYHLPISLTPKKALPADPARVSTREIAPPQESSGIDANGSRDLRRTREDEIDRSAALALLEDDENEKSASVAAINALKKATAIAMTAGASAKTALATATARTMPALRQAASRSVSVARQIALQTRDTASQLGALTRRMAAQAREILGPYPARKIQSLGMAAVAVIAIGIAVYVSLGLLRHKSPAQAAHAKKTTPPKVIIIKQTPKAAPAKRSAAQPAPTQSAPQPAARKSNKPSPRQSSAQTSPTAQASSPASPVQIASAPAATQPAAPQSTQPEAQSSVRRIDDGGADDEEPSPTIAPANRSSNTRSGGSPAGGQSVGIAQQVMPQVSTSALRTIHGTVRVSVRVRVDSSGKVARAELANAGPSRYFARKSLEAAQNWKFASGAGSPFLVHFEYRNNGARAFATRVGS